MLCRIRAGLSVYGSKDLILLRRVMAKGKGRREVIGMATRGHKGSEEMNQAGMLTRCAQVLADEMRVSERLQYATDG